MNKSITLKYVLGRLIRLEKSLRELERIFYSWEKQDREDIDNIKKKLSEEAKRE